MSQCVKLMEEVLQLRANNTQLQEECRRLSAGAFGVRNTDLRNALYQARKAFLYIAQYRGETTCKIARTAIADIDTVLGEQT